VNVAQTLLGVRPDLLDRVQLRMTNWKPQNVTCEDRIRESHPNTIKLETSKLPHVFCDEVCLLLKVSLLLH
jgi:hypothetical protein